ncbi:SDR family NAD(P)-dependent oxidoreductase [Thioclava sp. BHET1]|nr:SDR family NAD(P)-dependent oxidoreductase [Thioclava sp. BHET1]
MKIDLSGKTALATGSTKGIGLAAAKGLAEAGADIILYGRNPDEVADLARTLGARGTAVQLDTTERGPQLAAVAGEVAHMIV